MTHASPELILSIRKTIRTCTDCPLHTFHPPVPWSGDPHPDIAILGEAPGRTEAREGEPFVGDSGNRLRGWLRDVGLDPTTIAFVNSVSCFPDRPNVTPTPAEILACRPNARLQLALLSPRYLITVGVTALSSVRGIDTWPKLQHIHGKPLRWPNFYPAPASPIIWPTYHPAARTKKYRDMIVDDLAAFVEFRKREEAGEIWPSEECAICGDPFYTFDDWALPMCRRHSGRQGLLFPEDVEVNA